MPPETTGGRAIHESPLRKHWRLALAGGTVVAVVATLALAAYWLNRPLAPPKVVRTVQLTSSGQVLPGRPDLDYFTELSKDGAQVYFRDSATLAHVSTKGGESHPVPPLPERAFGHLEDISPDGSSYLIVQLRSRGETEGPLWVVTTDGETARRVGDVAVHAAGWSPDGQAIVYTHGNDLKLARSDGSRPQKVVSVPGRAFRMRFSPDGSRLRFTIRDPQADALSLWEVNADGSNLHPMLLGWNSPPAECCGNWTPDGKYFVFQSTRQGTTNIWAIQENPGLLRMANPEPVQLTTGPLNYLAPVPSRDGKRLFVVGHLP